jgi:mono/diheme cytochrome c family protein
MTRAVPIAFFTLLLAGCPNRAAEPPSQPGTLTASAPPGAAAPAPAPKTIPAPAAPQPEPLTAAERREFYHLPEGGELIPLELLRAVESNRTFRPFMEDLGRFRLIPDPGDPDGLPIGMSIEMRGDTRAEPKNVFFNCAACHVAQLTYKGRSLIVEGAPAHFDTAGFIVELLGSMESTVTDPKRLGSFLERLAAQRHGTDLAMAFPDLALPKDDPKGALLGRVTQLMKREAARATAAVQEKKARMESAADAVRLLKEKITYLQRLRALRTIPVAGFGCLDAFMAARNLLFDEKYAVDVNAPVSLPPIFGLTRLTWFHYDNNTTSLVQRNLGEDLGMGAVADRATGRSSVKLRNLLRLEALAARLPVPKWPEEILGKLDAARIAKGEPLYRQHCASCHEPAADGAFPDRTVDLATIGTDPNRALSFAAKLGDRPFVDVLAETLRVVQDAAATAEGLTPAQLAKAERGPVKWRATGAYSSRPIAGVWATAPYLHNGSVPTLYDLLLPPAQRPKTFQTGSREYLPHKVGYVYDGSHGGEFHFDTTKAANHNTGHTYGTALSEEDRLHLLEYLKSR